MDEEPDHIIVRKSKYLLYAIVGGMVLGFVLIIMTSYWAMGMSVNRSQTGGIGRMLGGFMGIAVLLAQLCIRGFLIGLLVHYFYALVIITPERIIHMQYEMTTNESVTIAELYRILSIEASQNGLFPGIFGYGSITLQLQNDANITLERIPQPKKIVKMISKRKEYAAENRMEVVVKTEGE